MYLPAHTATSLIKVPITLGLEYWQSSNWLSCFHHCFTMSYFQCSLQSNLFRQKLGQENPPTIPYLPGKKAKVLTMVHLIQRTQPPPGPLTSFHLPCSLLSTLLHHTNLLTKTLAPAVLSASNVLTPDTCWVHAPASFKCLLICHLLCKA